jgi:hypothetical protein
LSSLYFFPDKTSGVHAPCEQGKTPRVPEEIR